MVRRRKLRGQATIEYMLLLSTVLLLYSLLVSGLTKMKLTQNLMSKLTGDYARIYQYGHPKAKAPEDGGDNHPRAEGGANSFRIFISPKFQ